MKLFPAPCTLHAMDAKCKTACRALLERCGADAAIFLDADPHGSEYPAEHWRLRTAATGFDGSAGVAFLLANGESALWTDSRYFLAAAAALAGSDTQLMREGEPGTPRPGEWLAQRISRAATAGPLRILADPLVVSPSFLIRAGLEKAEFVGLPEFTSLVWSARPPLVFRPIRSLDAQIAGQSRRERLSRFAAVARKLGFAGMLLSALDDIAWLLNLRGSDIDFNPLFHAWFILSANDKLPSKLWLGQPDGLRAQLETDGVEVLGYESFLSSLPQTARRFEAAGGLWLQPSALPYAVLDALGAAAAPSGLPPLPVAAAKACKNDSELDHMRQTHIRDALALVQAFSEIEMLIRDERGTNEYELGQILDARRRQVAGSDYLGPSFEPIVGYLENGAIVHYRAEPQGSKRLESHGLLLIDSGGQYLAGTTDSTRTFALGQPSLLERELYTRVLKGHLRLSAAVFPRGTSGVQLDTLARQDLWAAGFDYGHGTGHGVGFALCVHEGPLRMSPAAGTAALEEGMIFSNEPGIYLAGQFGIRIENLVAVRPVPPSSLSSLSSATPVASVAKTALSPQFLRFETLTLLPYERTLIDEALLTAAEFAQINAYHRRVLETLGPSLGGHAASWLAEKCQPLEGV